MKRKNILLSQIKTILVSFIVLIAMVISSCTSVIDTDPYNSLDENVAFSTASLCEASVMGMYQAAQLGNYGGAPRGYPFGAAFIEQGDCRGEDAVNTQAFYQYTYEGTYTTGTLNNLWHWNDTYRLINRANIVIEGAQEAADEGIITQDAANSYKGEALFFRALAHHELLIHFSYPYLHTADQSHWGVPYRKRAYNTEEAIAEGLAQGRNSVDQCYTWIIEDLNQAEAWLPLKSGRSSRAKVSRATKEACAAIKTRIYQHMYDWDNVILEAAKFKTGGAYIASGIGLEAGPNDCFAAYGYSNKENVFSIENTSTTNPGVNAALASQYKRRQLVAISPIIWRNSYWLSDDKRRLTGPSSDINSMVFIGAGNSKYTCKYKDDAYGDGAPVIRYAEVLLNAAEAYARNNDVTNALTDLNAVRNRALADVATQHYVAGDFADNVELLGAILAERRIELVNEGRRWADIHRLQDCPYFPISGIPAKLANTSPAASTYTLGTEYSGPYGVSAKAYTSPQFLWPIPQGELDSNPVLAAQQNPGY